MDAYYYDLYRSLTECRKQLDWVIDRYKEEHFDRSVNEIAAVSDNLHKISTALYNHLCR